MKKLLSLILAFCLCATVTPIGAFNLVARAETYGNLTYTITSGEVTITDCTDDAISETIPSEIGGYPVTSIASSAFEGCVELTEVIIPDTMYSINNYAFKDCTKLENILIPDSVTSIGDSAFKNCAALETVTIPDSVTKIGEDVFEGSAYYNDESNWEDDVLYNGNHLIKAKDTIISHTIKSSTKTVAKSAFKDCTTLETITLPFIGGSRSENKYLGYIFGVNMHTNASNSLKNVVLTFACLEIPDNAFSGCKSIVDVEIANSVTSIGDSAFKSCSALTNVNIPDSVTSIGDASFYNCAKLKTATLSNNATSLGDYSFAECSDLEGIVIPDSITELGESAFKGCDSLTNITFGSGISEISYFAFSYCTSLATVTIPKTVKTIGYRSFYDCKSIETITIEDGVTKIDNGAFEYCTALKTVNIPRSVKDIGWYAFTNCNALENISVNTENENFTSVDGVLFSKDKSVLVIYPKSKSNEKYTIPNTVKEVEGFAFDNVTSLKDIIIPKSITSINTRAFSNCGLKNVFYAGNKSDWHSIDFSYGNSMLTTANIHYESTDHNHKNTITKATLSKNGSIVYKCEACKKINSVTTIYYPKTIKLSTTTYTYNGSVKKPSVTVIGSNGKTISSSNYTVSYASGRKYPGKYKVTVKFKGNYEGTKTLYFTVKPKKASLSSVKSTSKKKMTVKWSKQSGVTGYQVVYATNSKFTKGKKTVTVKGSSSKSKTIKSLKSKKTYYVKVRAYKTIDGKKVYGSYSKYKKVKVK